MRLAHLWLTDVRCYESAELVPAKGVTAVLGDNGQGKTTLLEAVAWLATARSFRGVPDHAMVRTGADHAIVRGEVVREGHDRLVEAEIARQGRNRIQVNGKGVPRAKALQETLRVTIFSPDDLELVKGGPAGRRTFLDELMPALSPRLGAALVEYDKVLRQRNALLRTALRDGTPRSALEVWDVQLAERGAEVVEGRLGLIERLQAALTRAYADLASGTESPGTLDVSGFYEAGWHEAGEGELPSDREGLAAALSAAVERQGRKELERGLTLVGPHRDDWGLAIGGLDARTRASQGEQRSLALALRLAGHAVLTDATGDVPVLLLDDVFSELDPGRSRALVHHLPGGQALVTTAAPLPEGLGVDLRLRVVAGRVVPA